MCQTTVRLKISPACFPKPARKEYTVPRSDKVEECLGQISLPVPSVYWREHHGC